MIHNVGYDGLQLLWGDNKDSTVVDIFVRDIQDDTADRRSMKSGNGDVGIMEVLGVWY